MQKDYIFMYLLRAEVGLFGNLGFWADDGLLGVVLDFGGGSLFARVFFFWLG